MRCFQLSAITRANARTRVFRATVVVGILAALASIQAQEARIDVQADQVVHKLSRYLTGACIEDVNHEIYGGIYSQMIFGESFQEPSPAPTIKGFKQYGGDWNVRDGVVSTEGPDGPKLVGEDAALGDGAAGVELLFPDRSGGNAGLIVRVEKPGNGADTFFGYEISLDAERQILRLGRHRNNFELIKDVPCEITIGNWIPLEVRCTGSTIEVLVNGQSKLRHDDGSNMVPGKMVGLRPWQRKVSYRNLWVKPDGQKRDLAFEQEAKGQDVSGMWRAVRSGTASGQFTLDSERPFVGKQAQRVSFESGTGQIGVENQGLNRWGLNFVQGKTYEACVWARAEKPTTLYAALESRDGSQTYAETQLLVTNSAWQKLQFTLTPNNADKAGRFTLKMKEPGCITLGYAFLQPGEWGRFKGLPIRRDVAEGLISQGITVLRYGGSMVNNASYRWKKMVGPRDLRQPYAGLWYPYSSNGWGIPDFMDFCESAGFEYVPAFCIDETPQDMADFIEYAKGSADTKWGRQRIADGHREPYRLPYIELGNEERVDAIYSDKFEALATAIWAKDPQVILVVGDFLYGKKIEDPFNFTGSASGITNMAAHQRILRLAREHDREVWFDLHTDTEQPSVYKATLEAMFSFWDALDKIEEKSKHKVVVFEFNAGNHGQRRAVANALALNAVERDGRLPIVTSANCLQPDGQNDNGWDQGLLFLNPSQVWLQPPGYVTQMLSHNYMPELVKCSVEGGDGLLDVNATRSTDGKTVVLQVVNASTNAVAAQIHIAGFVAKKTTATVTELSGPAGAVNTAQHPDVIVPKASEWSHGLEKGVASRLFAPYSVTVVRLE